LNTAVCFVFSGNGEGKGILAGSSDDDIQGIWALSQQGEDY
jgi:hypothetical protein